LYGLMLWNLLLQRWLKRRPSWFFFIFLKMLNIWLLAPAGSELSIQNTTRNMQKNYSTTTCKVLWISLRLNYLQGTLDFSQTNGEVRNINKSHWHFKTWWVCQLWLKQGSPVGRTTGRKVPSSILTAATTFNAELERLWVSRCKTTMNKGGMHKSGFNPFTASCENAMTLSVPGIPASCEKFPDSSQLNFWSTESIFNHFSVFLKTLNALCVCLQHKHTRSVRRVIRSDKRVTLLLLWSHKCDFGAEPRSRIIATSAVKGLMELKRACCSPRTYFFIVKLKVGRVSGGSSSPRLCFLVVGFFFHVFHNLLFF
jgi:hypothetical protein